MADECTYSLSSIISELALRAGMDPTKIDIRLLDRQVRGFVVTNTYPCTEAMRALAQAFFFDSSSYDGVLHFVPRGANAVATVTEEDMVDEDQDIDQEKRGDPIAIPRVVHLNYYDVDGGLATDKQSSERASDRRAVGEMSSQTPVLMTADEAAQTVDIAHKVAIEDQKGELTFKLPDSWLELAGADVLIAQYQGKSVRARIEKCDIGDGIQEYKLLRDRQTAYTSVAEGIPAAPQTPPPSSVVGATLLQLLDIKILQDVDDNVGLAYYVAIAGLTGAWQGAVVELSYDGGANYVDSAQTSVAAVIGELMTALPDHPQAYPDLLNAPVVRLDTYAAELTASDLAGMMNGDNLAIIGNELVQFADTDEVTEGQWEIATLLRGRKGTEPQSHPIGTRFVLLEREALNLIPAGLTDIGRTLTFRATSLGATPDTGTVVSIVFAGEGQTERAPGMLMAHRDGANMVVAWQGVGRLGAGVSAAHGARFTGYRVTFDDGVAPAIVVDTTAQTLTQNVAALAASPITITVQQLNALTGAGPAAEVIVT